MQIPHLALKEEGRLLMESILECRFLRPDLLLLEQVANFAVRPHRAVITRAVHWIGCAIVFQRTLNIECDCLLKVDRPRWFAVAVRVHSHVKIDKVPVWNVFSLHLPKIDAVFHCWNHETRPPLALT